MGLNVVITTVTCGPKTKAGFKTFDEVVLKPKQMNFSEGISVKLLTCLQRTNHMNGELRLITD